MTAPDLIAENRPMREITITNLVSLAPSCATEIVNGIVNTNISLNRLPPPILRCATSWRSLRMKALVSDHARVCVRQSLRRQEGPGNVQPGDDSVSGAA